MFWKFGLLLLVCMQSYGHKVPKNIALWKPSKQSTTYYASGYVQFSSHAVDDNTRQLQWVYCALTKCSGNKQPWWQVNLQNSYEIGTVTITTSIDSGKLNDFKITVYKDDPTTTPFTKPLHCYQHDGEVKKGATVIVHCGKPVSGRFVRITNNRGSSSVKCDNMALCDVKVTAVEKTRCPKGFVRNQDSCFWFSPYTTTWIGARSYCHVLNGRLAVVDNEDTDFFLAGYLKRIAKKDTGYYLGATDLAVENIWNWVDSKSNRLQYSNWAPGQPQSHHIHEHCLGMNESSRFKWHDCLCNSKNHFICEVKR